MIEKIVFVFLILLTFTLCSCSDNSKANSNQADFIFNGNCDNFIAYDEQNIFYTDNKNVWYAKKDDEIANSKLAIRDCFSDDETIYQSVFEQSGKLYILCNERMNYKIISLDTNDFSVETIYEDANIRSIDNNSFLGIEPEYANSILSVDQLELFWANGDTIYLVYDSGIYTFNAKSQVKEQIISCAVYNRCVSFIDDTIYYVDANLSLHRYCVSDKADFVFDDLAVSNMAINDNSIILTDASDEKTYSIDFLGENRKLLIDKSVLSYTASNNKLFYTDLESNLFEVDLSTGKSISKDEICNDINVIFGEDSVVCRKVTEENSAEVFNGN